MFATLPSFSKKFGLIIISPILRQRSTDIDTENTHQTPAVRGEMEHMLANPITDLTMHRVHDEHVGLSTVPYAYGANTVTGTPVTVTVQ